MTSSMFGRDNILEFLYAPYMAVYLLFYLVAAVLLCFYLLDRKVYFNRFSRHQRSNADCCSWALCCCPSLALPLIKFEATYQSWGGNLGSLALFLIRLAGTLCLLYFCAMRYLDDGLEAFRFFEAWTSLAALLYLTLALITSLLTALLWFRPLVSPGAIINSPTWSPMSERFAAFLMILRTLALSNCLFVAISKLALYNLHDGSIQLLLAPPAALAADLLASQLPHRAEHYWLAFLFLLAYLAVVWVAVFTSEIDWPYKPLRLAKPLCFAYYSFLLLIHAGAHALLVGACSLRNTTFSIPPRNYMRQPEFAILPKLALDFDYDSPTDDRLPRNASGDVEEGREEGEERRHQSPSLPLLSSLTPSSHTGSPLPPQSPSPEERRENTENFNREQSQTASSLPQPPSAAAAATASTVGPSEAKVEEEDNVPVAIARSFYGHP